MNNFRRIACIVSALPLAFYAYACSSDDGGGGTTPIEDDGGTSGSSGASGTSGSSGSSGSSGTSGSSGSSGTSGGLDGGDGGDAGPATVCIGNPLLDSPDAATPDGGVVADAAALQTIVPPVIGNFLDGPQWVDIDGGAGYLVFSEFLQTPSLRRVLPDGGGATTLRTTGFQADPGNGAPTVAPTGNAVRNGFIVTAAANKNSVQQTLFQTSITDGGVGPAIPFGIFGTANDVVVGKGGQIYFTAPGFQNDQGQAIFQTGPDGGAPTALGGTTEQPNGIAISPDGTKLYVSFTLAASKRVDAFPISAAGVVANTPTNVIPGTQLTDIPDGIAVDIGGNIYVAEAPADDGTFTGSVEVFTATGRKLGRIVLPGDRATGIAFGDTNRRSLFITGQRGVYRFTDRCAGLP